MRKEVVMSLEEYDELVKYKENFEESNKNKVFVDAHFPSEYDWLNYNREVRFYSQDGCIKELTKVNNKLIKENREMKDKVNLYRGLSKKMSVWEFLKWRKTEIPWCK